MKMVKVANILYVINSCFGGKSSEYLKLLITGKMTLKESIDVKYSKFKIIVPLPNRLFIFINFSA